MRISIVIEAANHLLEFSNLGNLVSSCISRVFVSIFCDKGLPKNRDIQALLHDVNIDTWLYFILT